MGTKENPGKYDCLAKAEPDEPVFVLLGRDACAPILVRMWAEMRGAFNPEESSDKLNEAVDCATLMERWKAAHPDHGWPKAGR